MSVMVAICGLSNHAGVAAGDLDVTVNSTLPAGVHDYDSITVRSGATLSMSGDPATGEGGTLRAAAITLETGAAIATDGQGYPAGQGSGGAVGSTGASHGGVGGNRNVVTTVYGSATRPVTLGSGGLNYAGGGAVHLIASAPPSGPALVFIHKSGPLFRGFQGEYLRKLKKVAENAGLHGSLRIKWGHAMANCSSGT